MQQDANTERNSIAYVKGSGMYRESEVTPNITNYISLASFDRIDKMTPLFMLLHGC